MNELFLISTAILDSVFTLFLFLFGIDWLYLVIIVNLILIGTLGGTLVSFFGFITNTGNVFYAIVFLATYILLEHGGYAAGRKAIWMGSAAMVLFIIMTELTSGFSSIQETQQTGEMLRTLFTQVPRVALASITAYITAQHVNIFIYNTVRKKTTGRLLWLRAGIAITIGQLVDSIVFFFAAFFQIVPIALVFQTMLVGYIVKVAVGFSTIPFIYISNAVQAEKEELLNS